MRLAIVIVALVLSGCGLTSTQNEAVGQVKRVMKKTPLLCWNSTELDMSLGVMKNGTGSVSHDDIWIRVQTPEQEAQLRKAADSGAPVRVTYDQQRYRMCWETREVTKVELLQ